MPGLSGRTLLAPLVDIALALGDTAEARHASDELRRISRSIPGLLLASIAELAEGAVLLAEGDPKAALPVLRRASRGWRELDAPHESARVRVLLGQTLLEIGERERSEWEFEGARRAFLALGAAPDVARLDSLSRSGRARSDGLSAREVDVLRSLAEGKTNRAIANDLGISERTVDRHVSNIFTKLDVSSPVAAATDPFRSPDARRSA